MRLTEKDGTLRLESITDIKWNNAIIKLADLEDIEEELGIDLSVLNRILTNGFWFCNAVDAETKKPVNVSKALLIKINTENKTLFAIVYPDFRLGFETGRADVFIINLSLEDFRKQKLYGWALTREELEK